MFHTTSQFAAAGTEHWEKDPTKSFLESRDSCFCDVAVSETRLIPRFMSVVTAPLIDIWVRMCSYSAISILLDLGLISVGTSFSE